MIEEASLYANLHVETSPIAVTAVWTDHISKVRDVSLSRGGIEEFIGAPGVQPGSGTISLVDFTATVLPGYWVRVRYSSSVIWAGYVQDVNVSYSFIDGVTYVVTTLTVLDWAAWIAQFSTDFMDRAQYEDIRRGQINDIAEGTPVLLRPPGIIFPEYVFDGLVGTRTLAEILDLTANTIAGYWKSCLVVPTGSGAGIDDIIDLHNQSDPTNYFLTDGTHTSGSLVDRIDYVDLQVGTRTSDVANSVVISNKWNLEGADATVTYSASDATSIATYGSRFASFETNENVSANLTFQANNLVPNPHLSHSSDYLISGTGNLVLNRQLLSDMATGATNFLTLGTTQPVTDGGDYVAVGRVSANTPAIPFAYGGPEFNGTYGAFLVRPSTQYTASVYQRGGVGQASMAGFAAIRWYDINGATISTSNGTSSTTTSTAWTRKTVTATSPATAYSAVMFSWNTFSGANNTGNRYFATGAQMQTGATATTWFSGDTIDTSSYLYFWYGEPGQSTSSQVTNNLSILATEFLNNNKNPKYSPFTVRVNAQDNLTKIVNTDLYKYCSLWFDSHRWDAIITGITHNISINADGTTRWMLDLNIRPSTYTI